LIGRQRFPTKLKELIILALAPYSPYNRNELVLDLTNVIASIYKWDF